MLIGLIVIFVILYIYGIIKSAVELFELKEGFKRITTYVNNYRNLGPNNVYSPKHIESFDSLMKYNPVISKFVYSDLSYNREQFENREISTRLANSLLEKLNNQRYTLKNTFNPLVALKKLFQLPSTILSFMGFRIQEQSAKWFNAVGWIVAKVFELFEEEIKALVLSIFQNFDHI